MMESIIDYFKEVMLEKNVIDQKQCPIVMYGLDLLFSSIISLTSLLFIALIMGVFGETLLLLLIFIPLQSFGGGYHCQTHFKCWMLMVIGYLFAMTFLINLPTEVLFVGTLLCAHIFIKYAPIENPKAPFGGLFRNKMRKITIYIYFLALIMSLLLNWITVGCAKVIFVAIILSGMSIISARVNQKNSGVYGTSK